MSDPRVAGVGLTRYGQHPERLGRDLFAEAVVEALDDAGIPPVDIETVYCGNFAGTLSERQGHQGSLLADVAGLSAPAVRYESACASSGMAFAGAVTAIRSGRADCVLVGGVERLSHLRTAGSTAVLATAADDLFEVRAGVTFPAAYALMERAYFEQYGGDREHLAAIAVKNHANALDNEYAQFQREIDVDDVLDAPLVADPIGLYDACPVTDGASAVVLVSGEYARQSGIDAPVAVTGSGTGGDRLALQDRASICHTPATAEAADAAYADSGIGPGDIDAAEVHDCFTIAEVVAIEALGFYPEGEGIDAAASGETTADGHLPVNLSGGLKAKGHPVGATGTGQIVAATTLLRGDHPNASSVEGSTVLTHNAGGTVASAAVHVLEAQS